ncbi:MAG: neutral/alkaline non-lysosomal ceramidase N-terminal domain-containing protein [Acidobacteria bacterium]|nr:neutral/alkaline non-lysosomal ceramidase N-terminal domain-containing protein [Acidobacteriota bacterium]
MTIDRRAFLSAAALAPLSSIRVSAARWRAGVAVADITPTSSLWMAGFAARTRPSQGTAMPLHAKALALEDAGGRRLVVVTLDLLGVTDGMAARISARVAKAHRLARERLLLAASHTHSGPVVDAQLMVAYDVTPQQVRDIEAYTATLEDQIVGVIGKAIAALAPATLHTGATTAAFAANRRVQFGENGPVDHRVPVLRVDVGGRARAVLFSYACHNTTLSAENVEWHGDYAGVAQAAIEAANPGVTALFMSGCGADANPKPRGTRDDVQRHGEELARAVSGALSTLTPVTGDARAAYGVTELPFEAALTPEQWKARFGLADPYVARHAREMDRISARDGRLPRAHGIPLQVWRIGKDVTLVAIGGEVVVDYALRLRREHPDANIWPVGYANDVFGYVPSRRILQEGGYEGGGALLYYVQPGPFDTSVEDRIFAALDRLIAGTR